MRYRIHSAIHQTDLNADTIERYGRMLTVKELAALVAESPKTIYTRVKRGVQPATLIGASIHFSDPNGGVVSPLRGRLPCQGYPTPQGPVREEPFDLQAHQRRSSRSSPEIS